METLGNLFGIAGNPEQLQVAMAYRAIAVISVIMNVVFGMIIMFQRFMLKWRKK